VYIGQGKVGSSTIIQISDENIYVFLVTDFWRTESCTQTTGGRGNFAGRGWTMILKSPANKARTRTRQRMPTRKLGDFRDWREKSG
jgi:hypothetical protein